MNIAIFSSQIEPTNGYGNITYELCNEFFASGISFTLFLPRSQEQVIQKMHVPYPVKCVLPEYIYRIYQPRGMRYFCPINVSQFDVVHSLFAFQYCIIAAVSAFKYKKPYIVGAQGTHGVRPLTYFPEKWLLKWCYKKAKRILVPSAFTMNAINKYAKESYKISVIHNGVRFNRFQNEMNAKKIREQFDGRNILLTVGGLVGRKGHDLVIRALPNIIARHPKVVYVMVGEGNAKSSLQLLSQELGVASHIYFAGQQSSNDLVSYFHGCDIYVHTPRVTGLKFEGFGIVYLEASACGKPIIATDAGGIRDAILNEQTGFIVPDGDIESISERICFLLDNPNICFKIGEAGRKYAKKHDWSVIASQFAVIYSLNNV
jgi:phosphatidylinositol alpha-1,6-mannosyltransferase